MIFSNRCDVLSVSPSNAIFDHFSVIADLKIPTDHSHTVPQTITYHKLKAMNMEAFQADINNFNLSKNPASNATELAQHYDSVLSTLIDFHAPLATEKISPKPPNPWMTPAILASRRHRRYLEWVWRRYPTALNTSRLSKKIHLCNRQMSKAKYAHYSKIIAEHSSDHRSLWQAFNKILHRCRNMYLPDHSSITTLAYTFSCFAWIKSPSFGFLSPLVNAQMYWFLQTPERSYTTCLIQLMLRCVVLFCQLRVIHLTSVICSSCINHIRDLRSIRRRLDLESAKLLANALVSCRFDYCNLILSGIAENDFTKLQRVSNCLACVVTKSHHFLAVFHCCTPFIGYQ